MRGWAIRHILWPLMDTVKGNRVRTYLEEMKQFQHVSPERIQAERNRKLQELLLHCVNHVPAYKPYKAALAAHITGSDWDAAAFLQTLPVLTKAHFKANSEAYLSDTAEKDKLIANRTGGSTGEPTRFYIDRFTVEHYEAARWRGLSWCGIRIGDPSVMIWGSAIELNQMQTKKYLWKEKYLKNRIMIPAYDLKEANLDQYLQQLREFKPRYLYGYASALHTFAEMMLRRGITAGISLKAVVSTSETLHDYQRESIHQAFGCPVVNEYGARDGGIIAYECPHGSMHIAAENCHLEVVDVETKQPVPKGSRGLLLVSDLNNYSMPRLRYELGDIAVLSEKSCSCGLHLPVLESIEGREDDMFVTTEGGFVHGHYFNHIMRNLTGFRTFQVVQHAPDSVSVKLVKHEELYSPVEEKVFIDGIYKALGEQIKMNVEYVDDIPRGPSGKFRYAIREFPLR